MRPFQRNSTIIDLNPVIDEALQVLPFIRQEADAWFRDQLQNPFYPRGIREAGTRITPDERVALGLSKWAGQEHISWEVWNALTNVGRQNAAQNFDDLCNRIWWNAISKAERISDNRFLSKKDWFIKARFCADHLNPCDAAKATHGAFWDQIPELPFPSCENRICRCTWMLLTERRYEREIKKEN